MKQLCGSTAGAPMAGAVREGPTFAEAGPLLATFPALYPSDSPLVSRSAGKPVEGHGALPLVLCQCSPEMSWRTSECKI